MKLKPTKVDEKWLVFYTKSRHEKKSRDFLAKKGFEVFLPLQKVVRQWSDRKKKVDAPLFNSYLFVLAAEDKISDILQTPGISWNLRHNDRPAVLRESEIAMIRRFLASGFFLETSAASSLDMGDLVEVVDGALRGLKGNIIYSSTGDKFSVQLESIQQNIIVTIESRALKKL